MPRTSSTALLLTWQQQDLSSDANGVCGTVVQGQWPWIVGYDGWMDSVCGMRYVLWLTEGILFVPHDGLLDIFSLFLSSIVSWAGETVEVGNEDNMFIGGGQWVGAWMATIGLKMQGKIQFHALACCLFRLVYLILRCHWADQWRRRIRQASLHR